jgi:uncharacterized cupin superfamily protein
MSVSSGGPISSESITWKTKEEGVRFHRRYKNLTPKGAHFTMQLNEVDPGRQSVPFHFHTTEEEQVLVLSGSALLRYGDTVVRMREGDFCVFPAGEGKGHCFVNDTSETFRYLMVGEHKATDVVVYPDSGKIFVRALGELMALGERRDYFDGERSGESPLPLKETK